MEEQSINKEPVPPSSEKTATSGKSVQTKVAQVNPSSSLPAQSTEPSNLLSEDGITTAAQDPEKPLSGNITFSELETAIDELDGDIESAFGKAADSLWSFASSVGNAVRETQPGLESLRKNVTSHLAPLDTIGRDLGAQLEALAPKDDPLAKITGSVRSVAATVQRNAVAMEEAILAKANGETLEKDKEEESRSAEIAEKVGKEENSNDWKPSSLPFIGEGAAVSEGISRVGETLSNSIVGQTVGGIWDGLWGTGEESEDEETEPDVSKVPRSRFEQRLFELQANPDTYCVPAGDLEEYEKWGKDFNLDEVAESCVELLHRHESIADLYIRVVPQLIEEDTFWKRYFFAKHVLEKEEERRQKLLERAETGITSENNDEEDGWGDDDWDDVDVPENLPNSKPSSIETLPAGEESAKLQDDTISAPNPSLDSTVISKVTENSESVAGQADANSIRNADASAQQIKPTTTVSQSEEQDWSDDDWE